MPSKPPRLPPLRTDGDNAPKRPSSTRRGYDSTHRRNVKQLLRERPLCEVRGERCTGWATEGHHLRYPAESLDDYAAVCRSCHIDVEKAKNEG